MNRTTWSRQSVAAATLLFAISCFLGPAMASPAPGTEAPPIALLDFSGATVTTASLAPRPIVLIFGDFHHEGVKKACADVLDVLTDPRLAGIDVVPLLIVSQDSPGAQLKDASSEGRFPALILNDPKRDAFGAYRIVVIPTIVVVDGTGKVVHSMPGFLQRFREILLDSVLVAAGKESQEQLNHAIDPKSQAEPHEAVRADRLAHLGTELTKHGLYDQAESRLHEALKLVPGHVGATNALGDLMLRQNRLADAEPLFRSVLATNPDSLDAALGIAAVQICKGGDDLSKAEKGLQTVLEKDPKEARAWFLMGKLHEQQKDCTRAMAEFRKSTELLLDR